MRKQSLNSLHFFAMIFLLPVVAYGAMMWYTKKFEKLPVYGAEEIKDGRTVKHAVANFELVNQEGLRMVSDGWKGKIVLVDFFFTHCPSICPKMTASLKKVQQEFSNKSELLINSISVDPEHDDVARLKQYAQRFKIDTKNWNLLTGDKKEIYKVARNEFMILATDGDGGPEDFIHSEKLILLDREKRIRGFYDGTSASEVNQLINDIKKLKDE